MKRILILILAAVSALSLASCEAVKNTPVTLAYSTTAAGHEVNASYSKEGGLILAAARLRVLTQK